MKKTKAYFFPRMIAYIIDIFLVSMVASLILMIIPANNNLPKLQEEAIALQENYMNKKITSEEFIRQYALVTYDIDYASVISYIIQVVVTILYFVVFQHYNKGQTFGKKLMKIQVVSVNDKELTFNDYLYRSIILDSVLANILIIILVMFLNKNYYFYSSLTLQMIQIVLSLVTIFMVLLKKDGRGIHDIVSHSKVVMID